MGNIRLYVRSVHRSILNLGVIFTDIRNIFKDLTQITERKNKINQTVNSSKEKLERKREIINSGISSQQSQVMNVIR